MHSVVWWCRTAAASQTMHNSIVESLHGAACNTFQLTKVGWLHAMQVVSLWMYSLSWAPFSVLRSALSHSHSHMHSEEWPNAFQRPLRPAIILRGCALRAGICCRRSPYTIHCIWTTGLDPGMVQAAADMQHRPLRHTAWGGLCRSFT